MPAVLTPRGPAGPGSGLTCVTKWSVSQRYSVIAAFIAVDSARKAAAPVALPTASSASENSMRKPTIIALESAV